MNRERFKMVPAIANKNIEMNMQIQTNYFRWIKF